MNRVPFLLASAVFAATAMAQTLVAPNGTAATEAASSTAYAWGRGSSQIRVQYVYDSTHFTAQGATFPILINQLRFRANGATTTAGYTYNNAIVQLSTAAVDYAAPSTTFASNHGVDLATVYAGAVTVASGGGTTPNNWYVTIPCTPFLYDPTSGNDLCLDLAHDGTGPTTTSGPAHDAMATGALTSRIYNLTNWQSATGSTQQNVGIVCEFTYTPASGLYPAFTANVTAGNSPLSVNFTDQSFSSAMGGVLSWAWDFNGDSIVDSTVQNPTFIYQNCGTYNVSLTVTDAQHPAATETKTGYIVVDQIAANFTASVSGGFAPLSVNFTDTSTGPVTAWLWDFDGDNVIDSTVQNPSWIYGAPGTYTVSLQVVNSCRTNTRTRTNLISVVAQGQVPAPPEILQYQFNEVRGQEVANTASTNAMAAQGTVTGAGWQADPGRPAFRGNEPGFGSLGDNGNAANLNNTVNTQSPLNQTGNLTFSWWQRMATVPGTTIGYTFGGVGSTARCFTGGVAGTSLWYRSTSVGDINATYNVQANPGVWEHVCLVIDNANGTGTWYFNGVQNTVTSFTPNAHTIALTEFHWAYQTSTSTYARYYDTDDVRIYSRALTAGEVLLLSLLPENASAGATGTTCPGTLGTIAIGSTGGDPTLGNASFAVTLGNAEDNRLAALVFGFTPATFGLFDLSPWLGAGCQLGTDPAAMNFFITTANSAQQGFAIPTDPSFAGLHVYAQWAVLGTQGATSRLLDINIR